MPETPLPTPETFTYDNAVGIFEGARYLEAGIYRPVNTHCRMNMLLEPFCPVCTEAHIAAMYLATGTTDGPVSESLTVDQSQRDVLDPGVIQTTSQTVRGTWTANDVPLPGETGATLTVKAGSGNREPTPYMWSWKINRRFSKAPPVPKAAPRRRST